MSIWLGHRRVDLDTCDSTNDEAARLARQGAAHGTVIIARAQHAGRGRHGRVWHSPEDENLYYSCILRPTCEPSQAPPITLAAGLGVADAVTTLGVEPTLKWPNDVLVGERKLAGVLTEMSTRGKSLEYVIVGIGVNLNTREFPAELDDIATSLRRETGADVERDRFIDTLCASAAVWFDRFFARGSRELVSAWMTRAAAVGSTIGRQVRVSTTGGSISGRIIGLEPDGRLRIEDAQGGNHTVLAGAVEYHRE